MGIKLSYIEMIQGLMASMPDDLTIRFFDKNKDLIHGIAEKCRKEPLYLKAQDKAEEFTAPLPAFPREQGVMGTWVHLLDRLSKTDRPKMHEGTIILFMPILDDQIRRKE